MSADSSQASGSSRPAPDPKADRYSRASQTALQRADTALNRQRDRDRAERNGVAQQARQDSEAAARRAIELSGKSSEIDQINALLLPQDASSGRPTLTDDAGAGSTPPKRQPAGGDASAPRGQTPPADDLQDDDDPERAPGPKSLSDFAGEQEVDLSEIYKLTVTTDDGESYTLSELKDSAKRLRDFDSREADFEDQREALYSEITVKRQNIDALLNRLKQHVPAEVLARAAVEADGDPEAARAQAVAQLREWYPEWKDHQAQQRDRERVETRLQAYGFAPHEVRALMDARVIRFLVDATRKLDRYDRLRQGERVTAPTRQAPSGRPRPSRTNSTDDRAAALVRSGDKLGAISTLIGDANGHDKSR